MKTVTVLLTIEQQKYSQSTEKYYSLHLFLFSGLPSPQNFRGHLGRKFQFLGAKLTSCILFAQLFVHEILQIMPLQFRV